MYFLRVIANCSCTLYSPRSYSCCSWWIRSVLLAAAFSIWINGVCWSQMTMNIWCRNIALFGTHAFRVIHAQHSHRRCFVYKVCLGYNGSLQEEVWMTANYIKRLLVWLNNLCFDSQSIEGRLQSSMLGHHWERSGQALLSFMGSY